MGATKYTAKIDNGIGGETTIEASGVDQAMRRAEKWAKNGDWSKGADHLNIDPLAWDGRVTISLFNGRMHCETWSVRVVEVRS